MRERKGPHKATNSDKTITLILDEKNDCDITEQPSYCHVFAGKNVTFESSSRFFIKFDHGSPFHESKFEGKRTGRSKNAITLPVNSGIPPGTTYKYQVTLWDSGGQPHSDSQCPTIIVGDPR
jgi:hypothetical protein